MTPCPSRHCEQRSDEATQTLPHATGLLRFARNDGGKLSHLHLVMGTRLAQVAPRPCALPAIENSQQQIGQASERRMQEARSVETALQEYALAVREGLKTKLAVIGTDARGA